MAELLVAALADLRAVPPELVVRRVGRREDGDDRVERLAQQQVPAQLALAARLLEELAPDPPVLFHGRMVVLDDEELLAVQRLDLGQQSRRLRRRGEVMRIPVVVGRPVGELEAREPRVGHAVGDVDQRHASTGTRELRPEGRRVDVETRARLELVAARTELPEVEVAVPPARNPAEQRDPDPVLAHELGATGPGVAAALHYGRDCRQAPLAHPALDEGRVSCVDPEDHQRRGAAHELAPGGVRRPAASTSRPPMTAGAGTPSSPRHVGAASRTSIAPRSPRGATDGPAAANSPSSE